MPPQCMRLQWHANQAAKKNILGPASVSHVGLEKEMRVLSPTVVHIYQGLASLLPMTKTHYSHILQGYDVTTIKLSIYETLVFCLGNEGRLLVRQLLSIELTFAIDRRLRQDSRYTHGSLASNQWYSAARLGKMSCLDDHFCL